MKKILMTEELKRLYIHTETRGFVDRANIKLFTAATNDEMLKIHIEEKVDLIVTQLDLPGVRSEELFDIIRQSKDLQGVSTIIICEDTPRNRQRCGQCGANAVFTPPIDRGLFLAKIQELLEVAPRRSYRVALSVSVEGTLKNVPLLFRMENISASGMLIRADDSLSQDDPIFFSFFLPDETHVRAHGKIERVVKREADPDSSLYGVKFTDIDPDDKFAIEKFVKKEQERVQTREQLPSAEIAALKKTA
jgi:DNA-binding response OmpR family regulator